MENHEIVHCRNLFYGDVKAFFSNTMWFWFREGGGRKTLYSSSTVQEQWVICSLLNAHYYIMACFFIPSVSSLAPSLSFSEFELSRCCNFNT